jgi:hypothetical protein
MWAGRFRGAGICRSTWRGPDCSAGGAGPPPSPPRASSAAGAAAVGVGASGSRRRWTGRTSRCWRRSLWPGGPDSVQLSSP